MTDCTTIAPLTKVTLTVQAETAQIQPPAANMPADLSFIFGIGIEGLTDFELAILGKAPGDHLTLPIGKVPPSVQLEHLLSPLMEVVQIPPPFDLHVEVKSVVPATDLEVVHALSHKTDGGGCDCGGGCGCGG